MQLSFPTVFDNPKVVVMIKSKVQNAIKLTEGQDDSGRPQQEMDDIRRQWNVSVRRQGEK